MRLTWRSASGDWETALDVANLTDEVLLPEHHGRRVHVDRLSDRADRAAADVDNVFPQELRAVSRARFKPQQGGTTVRSCLFFWRHASAVLGFLARDRPSLPSRDSPSEAEEMSRIILVTVLLASSAIALSASTAVAQDSGRGSSGTLLDGSVETCQTSGGGTRVNANCEFEEETAIRQLFFPIPSIKQPDLLNGQCEVATATNYLQRNTLVRVEGTIRVTDCTAAAGTLHGGRARQRRRWRDQGARFPRDVAARRSRSRSQLRLRLPDRRERRAHQNVRVQNLTCACADKPDAAADTSSDSPPK